MNIPLVLDRLSYRYPAVLVDADGDTTATQHIPVNVSNAFIV